MDLEACGMRPGPNLKTVESFIDIDLSQPIDLSQYRIFACSAMPMVNDADQFRYFEKKALLGTFVINEHGEQEELTIEFTLKSQRGPKKINEK